MSSWASMSSVADASVAEDSKHVRCVDLQSLSLHRAFVHQAMAIAHGADLSTALFAPGWFFETLDPSEFLQHDRK